MVTLIARTRQNNLTKQEKTEAYFSQSFSIEKTLLRETPRKINNKSYNNGFCRELEELFFSL